METGDYYKAGDRWYRHDGFHEGGVPVSRIMPEGFAPSEGDTIHDTETGVRTRVPSAQEKAAQRDEPPYDNQIGRSHAGEMLAAETPKE